MKKNKNIDNFLNHVSEKKSGWMDKAIWREENEDWLDLSFEIALKILSALTSNKKEGLFPKNQKELSEAMKCTPQYINKLLRGQENLQIETICKIQRILGISLIEIPQTEIKQKVSYSSGIETYLFTKSNLTPNSVKLQTEYKKREFHELTYENVA